MLLVTKDVLAAGSTRWAQGGIAAALGLGDTPDQHFADTVVAGAGVCDEAAVRVLVREGASAVRELAQMGARFDRAGDGELSLTREGGHHRDRIAHAGGDATGAEIERALVTRVLDATGVDVIEHALVLDLLTTADGAVAGLTLHVMGEGERDGVGAVRARAVVLATGGIGQVYASTTNPSVSTGDGVAAALRAGAVVRDLEFVQFHPTVAWLGSALARAAAAGQRGRARRGRVPGRRRRHALHAGRARARRPRARATSSRRRSCGACATPAPSTSGSTRGTSARRSGGCGSRPSTPRCSRWASTRCTR